MARLGPSLVVGATTVDTTMIVRHTQARLNQPHLRFTDHPILGYNAYDTR